MTDLDKGVRDAEKVLPKIVAEIRRRERDRVLAIVYRHNGDIAILVRAALDEEERHHV